MTSTMTQHDLHHLQLLLSKGYSLQEALHFFDKKGESILIEIAKGKELKDVLLRNQKPGFIDNFNFFISILPIDEAIQLSLYIENIFKELQKDFIKKSIYPLIIFVFSMILIYFFSTSIIPMLLEGFQQDQSFTILHHYVTIIKFICNILIFILILILLLVLFLLHKKRIIKDIHEKFPISFLRQYISFRFSIYLSILQKYGISTKEMIEYFHKFDKNSLFYMFMDDIANKFMQGIAFKKILVETNCFTNDFIQNCKIGMQCDCIQSSLEIYQTMQKEQWNKTIKKTAIYLQCISYIFVANVVIIVYQMLLIPLNILENMH